MGGGLHTYPLSTIRNTSGEVKKLAWLIMSLFTYVYKSRLNGSRSRHLQHHRSQMLWN